MALPDLAAKAPSSDLPSSARWPTAVSGLLLTPLVVAIAAMALPYFHCGDESASLIVFGGAASTSVAALAIAARSYPATGWRVAVGVTAVVLLAILAWTGITAVVAAIAVDAALVAAAWAIGTSIGRRIEHPGHLLPACVVVACADAASMVSRFGPTHVIAENERALSVVAIAFPVPGTSSVAPALGVGDLIFMAIVFGAVAGHGLSLVRAALLCGVGTAVAGAASAMLNTAVPALVSIAAALVLGLPEARRVRPRERRVASLAMAVAISVALAVIVAQLVHG
ncbi:MAG TPA: hypothetical protein VK550_08540 [Polyangiaceae bacterium]|nr:hypothetical protein [Polyangiaceae bacterium]